MKKILVSLLFLGLSSFSVNAGYLAKKPIATPAPVPAPAVAAEVEEEDTAEITKESDNLHNFIFVNNFNAKVTVSVLTDPTQKAQVIDIQPKKEGIITGKCLYKVKVSSGKFTIYIIPGVASSNDLESFMPSDRHTLCMSSKFEIKSSEKDGLALTSFGF